MSIYVDLYTALWHHAYGPERYAKRKDSPGQLSLFPHGGHDVSDQPREPDGRWTTGGNSAKDSPAPDDPTSKKATVKTEADRGSASTEPKAEGGKMKDLKGSEKQVAWANQIRQAAMDGVQNPEAREILANVEDARFWIENKGLKDAAGLVGKAQQAAGVKSDAQVVSASEYHDAVKKERQAAQDRAVRILAEMGLPPDLADYASMSLERPVARDQRQLENIGPHKHSEISRRTAFESLVRDYWDSLSDTQKGIAS